MCCTFHRTIVNWRLYMPGACEKIRQALSQGRCLNASKTRQRERDSKLIGLLQRLTSLPQATTLGLFLHRCLL